MVTRDTEGYTIRRTGQRHPYYIRHRILVDGFANNDDGKFDEIGTFRNRKDALKAVRDNKKKYQRIALWDEWVEEDIDPWNGKPILGDIVSQTVEDYVDGRQTNKTKIL